jgi:hypothetical protein
LRAVISDPKSPLVYGYNHTDVPVYFSQAPVLNAGAGAMPAADNTTTGRGGRGGGGGGSGFGGGGGSAPATVAGLTADPNSSTRAVTQFPAKAEDMLLSGTLERGDLLSNRANLVDEKIGGGHAVMFAFRPY